MAFIAAPCIPVVNKAYSKNLAFWGDSLTFSYPINPFPTYPLLVGGAMNRASFNGGVFGQNSTQILARMVSNLDWPSIIWAGYNDVVQTVPNTTIEPNIAAMVALVQAPVRFLVLSIINGSSFLSGSAGYNQIIALNAYLAATYGNNFLDVRTPLVAAYNPSLSQDVIDHTNDIVPTSLRNDNIHLNLAGYTLLAQLVTAKLEAMGY
jgi:lysophospholipase L1-like esterase